ncbi:hypothetical protein [Aldersonia kunmingensis]|uniref:hypothetical protein n=1 Tax=Aldersonia kunmingensis TaxID=408066 RepID=UPI0012EE377E
MRLGSVVAPVLRVAGAPIGFAAATLIRLIRPVASSALQLLVVSDREEQTSSDA